MSFSCLFCLKNKSKSYREKSRKTHHSSYSLLACAVGFLCVFSSPLLQSVHPPVTSCAITHSVTVNAPSPGPLLCLSSVYFTLLPFLIQGVGGQVWILGVLGRTAARSEYPLMSTFFSLSLINMYIFIILYKSRISFF